MADIYGHPGSWTVFSSLRFVCTGVVEYLSSVSIGPAGSTPMSYYVQVILNEDVTQTANVHAPSIPPVQAVFVQWTV